MAARCSRPLGMTLIPREGAGPQAREPGDLATTKPKRPSWKGVAHMPITPVRKLTVTCAGALIAALALMAVPSISGAATAPVDIRVLTADGKTIVDQRQYVAPIKARTSARASCFGEGTGGSGAAVSLPGLTALGALYNAAPTNRALNPILLTDHDFGFPGLGLCGVGGPTPEGQFWFLKTDRKNPQVSGDQAKLKRGSTALWYLMPFDDCDPNPPYACASELVLTAPARVKPGTPFTARVTAFDDAGKRTPVEGARVTGAAKPTDASGRTQVTLRRAQRLVASRDGAVPSAPWAVCVNSRPAACPASPGLKIVGSTEKDRIVGTPGPDVVHARQGGSIINVRGGGRDRVICLGARQGDTVIADRSDIVRGCKTVRRR